ncbi:hypothetical protein BH10ACI1_BH10ACI1_28760 [soil metagenome]
MLLRKIIHILLLIIIAPTIFVIAAKAQLDQTFGTNGTVLLDVQGTDKPLASFLLPNGKIFVINESQVSGNSFIYSFIRFNSDGTPDASYGTNGIVQIQLPIPAINPRIVSAARQSDGKILLAGGQSVMRFNENGTIDTTFSGDGFHTPNVDQQATETVDAVIQQPDGKILVAGTIIGPYPENRPLKIFFVRYETNGDLDLSFGDQGGFIINNVQYASLSEIALQADGKILTVPQKTSSPSNPNYFFDGAINRFNSNGTIDGSFSPIFFAGGSLRGFKLLKKDRFLVAGSLTINDQLLRVQRDITVKRYSSTGILDPSFGNSGTTIFDVTSSMIDDAVTLGVQPDGKIIIAGVTSVQPNRSAISGLTLSMVRLNANGLLDGKYLATNLANYYYDHTDLPIIYQGQILIQPDGKVISVSTKIQSEDLLLTRSTNIPFETRRLHGNAFSFLNIYNGSPGIYRPSNRNWYFNPSLYPTFFGLSDDILAPADFVGDFRTDLAVFRPSNGTWYIAKDYLMPSQNYLSIHWGKTGDIPIPRDYDGDSKADIAVFRPENGVWYIRKSSDNAIKTEAWGITGDKPVAGDFDGDGIDDIAVWRPSDGNWYICQSTDGKATILHFGMVGDIPVQDDYDNDGKVDVAVWRPSTGNWYIMRSSDNGFTMYNFGLPGDIPIPADYDGDRRPDIGIWRPDSQYWYINYSNDNSLGQFRFGVTNDIPTQGRN